MVSILMAIGDFFVGEYWWLLIGIILVVIGEFCVGDIDGY